MPKNRNENTKRNRKIINNNKWVRDNNGVDLHRQ